MVARTPRTSSPRSPSAEVDACADGFHLLAAFIAGPGRAAPDGLASALRSAASAISLALEREPDLPGLQQQRAQVRKTIEAARYVRLQLADTNLLRLLREYSYDDLADDLAASSGLGSLISRLDDVLGKLPSRKGRYKHPGIGSPLEICAASIATAWRIARGSLPGNKDEHAWTACSLLWLLGGGDPRGYGGNQTTLGWREHLRSMKATLESGQYPEVTRLFDRRDT